MFREKNAPTAKGPLKNSAKPWPGRTLGENEEEEDLADSGRLFVRNLPYSSTEEDLGQLFSRFGRGPVSCSPRTPTARSASTRPEFRSSPPPGGLLTTGKGCHPSSLHLLIHRWG